MSSDCHDCRTLLGGYVLHALEPDEAAQVRSHLAVCSACAEEHAQLTGIPAMLDVTGAVEAEVEHPPAALEEAVLDRFAREHPAARPSAPVQQQQKPRATFGERLRGALRGLRRPLPAALAGALAAAAITAALLTLPGGTDQQVGANGEWYEASLSGLGPGAGATATADLRVMASGTHVSLRVRGLRGTPDTVYELWCLRDDGAKVSAGTFRTNGAGHADVSLTTAAVPGEYHRLSVERKRFTPSGAPGDRVMAGEILYPHG
jgi:anti-sigma factor RsiW